MRARDKGVGCISWILMVAALLFLLLAAREYAPFLLNDIKMDQLQKEVAPVEENEDTEPDSSIPGWAARKIDWEKLRKTNPDIIAWITVPGTKIDYPVLSCRTWNEYLHKDYTGEPSKPGSVFIQPETGKGFNDFHTIVFGHNMRNQSMFGSLHRYEEESFWNKHRKIYVYQPGRASCWRVFSAYDCRDGSETYRTEYKDTGAKEEWLRMIREGSYYKTKEKVGGGDSILTLSTCSNGGPRSSRYVVHALRKEVIIFDE